MQLIRRMVNSITQSRRSCVYIDTYWVMSLHIHTYILWGETRIPGDVWRLNFIDISRRETIVVPACFYMAMGFCVGACLPVWSGCPAPRGSNQPQRRGRSGCGCCIPRKVKAEDQNEVWVAPKENRSWIQHPPLSEQEILSVFMGDFLCQVGSPEGLHMSTSCLCMFMSRPTHFERCQGLSQYG